MLARVVVSALLLSLLLPAAGSAQHSERSRLVAALVELDARDLDGTRWNYRRLRGRITLVDFWATWCAPCVRELPYLRRARARYGDTFQILGISLDTASTSELRRWMRTHDVRWPTIHASGGFDDALARRFGIDRLPTNLLIDPDGRIHELDVRGEALFEAIDRIRAARRLP